MQERNQQIGGHKKRIYKDGGNKKQKSAAKSVKAQNTKAGGREMAGRPRAKMSVQDRAKQFLPFAALKGLPEALAEKRAGSGAQNHSDRGHV